MATARNSHTATLLLDGHVLVAEGDLFDGLGDLRPINRAELYDPSTGAVAATGNMTHSREFHTATLLPDGRVLIAGGYDGSGHLALTAELYDPSTGLFTATGMMASIHSLAVLLNNGKVLMGPPAPDGNAELFDPRQARSLLLAVMLARSCRFKMRATPFCFPTAGY